jgi:peptidoglycan/xylan/chitin deacetylase (PgdA/CDA1 family)
MAPYRRRAAAAALCGLVSLTLSGCTDRGRTAQAARDASHPPAASFLASPTTPPAPSPTPADPAAVGANELGVVPVLMFHQVVERPRGVYDQTPDQFRAEIDRLYREGYRPVTAAQLVSGEIDLPAGRSPVVLTFDDSTVSQYAELPDGRVDPASAVGILLEVAARHGDERPVATFYVNAAPFAGREDHLVSLHALGMEVGAHTAGHARLDRLDASGVQREMVQGIRAIAAAVPDADVTTMALPLGRHPADRTMAHRGTWDGQRYDLTAVMLVGAQPAPSPHSAAFVPHAVPRILSGRDKDEPFASAYWLDRIGDTRYVSDGDPDVVSFPQALADRAAPAERRRVRRY